MNNMTKNKDMNMNMTNVLKWFYENHEWIIFPFTHTVNPSWRDTFGTCIKCPSKSNVRHTEGQINGIHGVSHVLKVSVKKESNVFNILSRQNSIHAFNIR